MTPPVDTEPTPLALFDDPVAGTVAPPPTAGSVRVLTWNVQHANPARARRQAAWLACSGADVLVLTEVSDSDGGRALDEALRERGFSTHLPAAATRDYRVLLAARRGALDPVDTVRAAALPHRCLAARVTTTQLSFGLVGLYVPSRGGAAGRNVAKRAFQQAVRDVLPGIAEEFPPTSGPLIVAGDLNVVEPGHRPHHAVFGGWEYDFYQAFADTGLRDAFRHLHPDSVDHSWYGRSGAGYRFDHIFCSTRHLPWLSDVGYLHEPRLAGLSDHSAMTATVTADH